MPHPRKLDSVDKWLSAFHVFMSIYAACHPSRILELLKYTEIIRTAAAQFPGLGWRNYDEQFRLRMELNPSCSWAAIDMELWVTVAAVGSLSVAAPAPATFAPIPSPQSKRVCFPYNSIAGCRWASCRYTHSCSPCGRLGHGATCCRVGTCARAGTS